MAAQIQYGLKWQFSVVAIGQGNAQMDVPSAQVLTVNQNTSLSGSAPPGIIAISSTGNYPTTANMSTALSAAATAAGVILNANPALAQWQGFNSGGG